MMPKLSLVWLHAARIGIFLLKGPNINFTQFSMYTIFIEIEQIILCTLLQTSAYGKMLPMGRNRALNFSVKFIPRMQWVASGDVNGFITVCTYVDNMKEIKCFRAENDKVVALAVHPTQPYLLSCSKDNLIKLWNWDQSWMCTRKFSCYSDGCIFDGVVTFNPNNRNSFASVCTHGHANKNYIKVILLSLSLSTTLLYASFHCTL